MRARFSWGESLLLRRITKHVTDQNWFAVFIDFCIVVIGVFIGIQVANWNEARANAVREQVILADLLDDLKADQATLSAASQLTTLGIDAGNMMLIGAGLEPIESVSTPGQSSIFLGTDGFSVAPPSQPTEATRHALWTSLTVRLYPTHNDATIESLIAADNSSIIEDSTLVRDLLRYRTLWTGVEDAQVNTFRPIRDRTIFVGQEHGFSPLTHVEYASLVDALGSDLELEGAVRTMIALTVAQQRFYESLQAQSQRLRAHVEAELEK